MIIIGIDYSMTSPSICLADNAYVYVTNVKNRQITINEESFVVKAKHFDYQKSKTNEFDNQIHRFNQLSVKITEDWIDKIEPGIAVFENYAMSAKGNMTGIAENTGILKSKLSNYGWHIETVAIPTVKKFATGSGRASKEEMADAWFKIFGFHAHDKIGCLKGCSPASDIVDSYFVRQTYLNKRKTSQ